jgi:hypothetical protein
LQDISYPYLWLQDIVILTIARRTQLSLSLLAGYSSHYLYLQDIVRITFACTGHGTS